MAVEGTEGLRRRGGGEDEKPNSKKAQSEDSDLAKPKPGPAPAILSYDLTDWLSTIICGYIGGRCMQLKFLQTEVWTVAWWAWGLTVALVTTFGGGTWYALAMKPRPERSFGFLQPLALALTFLGFLFSIPLVPSCGHALRLDHLVGLTCSQVFGIFDCLNCGILIAWGCSKSFVDCKAMHPLSRLLVTLAATYAYSFGGGITRDLVATVLLGEASGGVGNFSIAVVMPALVGTLTYHVLLVLRSPFWLQLGAGVPAVSLMFHAAGQFLS